MWFLLLHIALYTADLICLALTRVMPSFIDSDEEQEMMDLQESATQENATCFATCSSAPHRRVGNEAITSSTNMKDCEAEGTGTVSF